MNKHTIDRKHSGFSILEVVIGIFIFAVGLLALAALQGALTRSMSDSKFRTTAVNIGDRAIERQRGFTALVDATSVHAYNDIVTADTTATANGVTYAIDMDVTDYYYYLKDDAFCKSGDSMSGGVACPTGATSSDYKKVEVTVSWNSDLDFRAAEGTDIDAADLGTGSITLTSVIPAIITSASARVADETSGDSLAPPVAYTPGANPDIVALSLGDSKFKESLLPEPDVIRSDELVQTVFDVITYSQGMGFQFLRREEFASVSCECTLRDDSESNLGRRPVIWAGDEYKGGHEVEKDYGESANNTQSSLCDSCCRDHHDGGDADADYDDEYANVYGPFKAANEYSESPRESDHIHYKEDATTPADDGDKYLESCRLVRVDGFFRVAQDFRREDQYVFPADFLDETAEITTYSNYVTGAAAAYANIVNDGYPTNSPPCIGGTNPPCVASPTMQGTYDTALGSTELPSWTTLQNGVLEDQQLRSRGIYIDYLSDDLRSFLSTCFSGGDLVDGCSVGDVEIDRTPTSNQLEMLPFFDVQLTKLENWDQTVQANLPISVSNEPLEDANAHSRGEIVRVEAGVTDVTAKSHRGNIGFTNTLPIDPVFEMAQASLNVQSLGGGGGGGTDPTVVAGNFTEEVRANPTITVTGSGGAICTLTPNGYTCSVSSTATSPTVTVSGYEDTKPVNPEVRYACSSSNSSPLIKLIESAVLGSYYATFDLTGLAAGAGYSIVITLDSSC